MSGGGVLVHDPGNYHRIKSVWMAISVDEDGDEGLCAFLGPDGLWMPLVATDEKRLELITEKAKEIAHTTGRLIHIIRFDTRTTVQVIDPKN